MRIISFFTLVFIFNLTSFSQTEDIPECRELYDNQKFVDAYDCYAQHPDKVFSVYMSAYLAKFLGYKKEFKKWNKLLLSDQFKTSETFYYGAYLHAKNSKKFLKTIDKGLKIYPKDTLLLTEKVNYYIEIESYEEGIPILEELLTIKQNKLPIYVTIANIYNWLDKEQKAIPFFEKILALDGDNYEGNYGLGMIYYNRAADMIQSAQIAENSDESDRYQKEAISLLRKALPYLQKTYTLNHQDNDIKSALLTCYLLLEMDEEYKALKES